ncbi:MAG: polysaccharide biosynthesis C-terminal domain-containing protein [Planctomycetota bacterium]|jgi:dTDP-4-dehydrorhamnose 3,5-epimerase
MDIPDDLASLKPVPIELFEDDRGTLWKVLKAKRIGKDPAFGELYTLFSRKGASRGNHFHRKTAEWFCAIQGTVRCKLALPARGERAEFVLKGAQPSLIRIPPGVAHSLVTESEEPSIVLAFADREYDEASPDAIPFDF